MADRRQHLRVPVALKVSYPSRGDLVRDLVTDLSPGGLFVRTSRPLPIGTDVQLEVFIGEDPATIVAGRVMWLRGAKGGEGMGIQFTGTLGPMLVELVGSPKSD